MKKIEDVARGNPRAEELKNKRAEFRALVSRLDIPPESREIEKEKRISKFFGWDVLGYTTFMLPKSVKFQNLANFENFCVLEIVPVYSEISFSIDLRAADLHLFKSFLNDESQAARAAWGMVNVDQIEHYNIAILEFYKNYETLKGLRYVLPADCEKRAREKAAENSGKNFGGKFLFSLLAIGFFYVVGGFLSTF